MTKLEAMSLAGKVASTIQSTIPSVAAVGVSLKEIDSFISASIEKSGMRAAFMGFHGYPASSCISVNDAVVHAIPTDYRLKRGDIFSVDLGIEYDGWIVDMARTYAVGTADTKNLRLIQTTAKALDNAIALCRVNKHIGDLGAVISATVESEGFAIVEELTGHGVGNKLQETPPIPNMGKKGGGPILRIGQTIALEPISTVTKTGLHRLKDGWTVVTDNHSVAAHFEDTVFITENQPINLTRMVFEHWPT